MEDLTVEARLKWQCRRGMRELDELLLDFLQAEYAAADEDLKAQFQALLALPDPQIMSYLLQKQLPANEVARVVARILRRTET